MREFKFRAEDSSKPKLSGLTLGFIYFSGIKNSKQNPEVDGAVDLAIKEVCGKFPDAEKISEDPVIKGIRSTFSRTGLDPTKERPSGEALTRRAVLGKGICRINSVVDMNNVVSLKTGCPCGVYDAKKIEGDEIMIKVGLGEDAYPGIGGRVLNGENRILTSDSKSIFGGPTADSARTSINLETKEVLMLIYHPSSASAPKLEEILGQAAALMESTTSGKKEYSGIFLI